MNKLEKLDMLERELIKAQTRVCEAKIKLRMHGIHGDGSLESGALKRQMLELGYVWRRDLEFGAFLNKYHEDD